MFKHYLNVIRRNFVRHPLHTSLNTFCLAISITATLFMLLYIHFELTYDRFHSQAERIYRIETPTIETHDKVNEVQWTTTPANLITYLAQDYPEVEASVRCFTFWRDEEVKLQYQDEIYVEEDIFAADAALLDIFSFELIRGDVKQALHGPNKIMLSETLAKRIFGNQDPIGKLLESRLVHNLPDTKENYTLMVTGVYRDLPKNTHLPASAVISSATDPQLDDYYFSHFNVYTYVLLPQQNNAIAIASGLSQIYAQYLNANLEPVLVGAQHRLAPLTTIHLQESGGLAYVYTFWAVSLLLLGLAIISYVNLLTAQANHRIREVGIRKVMGSRRSQLVFQFMAESFFYAGISLVVGIILLILSLDFLNVLLGLQLNFEQLANPSLLLGMVIIFGMLGGLGGSYPAFVLASFQPLMAMKDRKIRGRPVQSILLTVQFSVVLFVLSCTMMINNQLQFLRNKDLGFDQEQIVILNLSDQDGIQRAEVLKEALVSNTSVVSVGAADFIPGNGDMTRGPVSADG
jgi:putative ABC transport system permease protein